MFTQRHSCDAGEMVWVIDARPYADLLFDMSKYYPMYTQFAE